MRRTHRGAITAEIAVTLPILLTLLYLGVWSIGLVIVHIQCIDAARDTARALARGESPEAAHQLARRTAPANATITISREPPTIHVSITATPATSLPLLPAPPISAKATIQSEPSSHAPS